MDRKLAKLAAQARRQRRNESAAQPGTERCRPARPCDQQMGRRAGLSGYHGAAGGVIRSRQRARQFCELAHEFFPGWALADVVTLGCKANVLERVGADKVALLNNCVLFPGNSPLILAFAIRTVRRVLRAADFNRRVTSAIEGWPDRAVWVEMSDEDFRDFVKFIRPQISGSLEMSHRWLTRRAALPKNRRKKKRLAGIQMFVFRE